MPLETANISAISADPNAPGRYGAGKRRAREEDEVRTDPDVRLDDRLELSEDARAFFERSLTSPDIDFARKALDRVPPASRARQAKIQERIASGYYQAPAVVHRIAAKLAPKRR